MVDEFSFYSKLCPQEEQDKYFEQSPPKVNKLFAVEEEPEKLEIITESKKWIDKEEPEQPIRQYTISTVKPAESKRKVLHRNSSSFDEPGTPVKVVESMSSSKVYVDSENSKIPDDYFLLEHDSQYVTGLSFHVVVSWIFASGPKMLEAIMKPLFRLVA